MSPRSKLLTAIVSASLTLPLSFCNLSARAEDLAQPEQVETAKNSLSGIVNANSVFVHSGPSDMYYPTIKLEKGAKVTVVGIKQDWLKIVPPEGSFCYIAKAYVEKRGDGTVGRVTKETVNVRAGSVFNNLKIVPLCQLSQGADVTILGEQEEYFKIKPPEGAFVYINKQFIDQDLTAAPTPISPVVVKPVTPPSSTPLTPPVAPAPLVADTGATPPAPVTPTDVPVATPAPRADATPPAAIPPLTPGDLAPQTTTPTDVAQGGGPAMPPIVPTTNPSPVNPTETAPGQPVVTLPPPAPRELTPAEIAAQAEQLFDQTENAFAAANGKPIEQQPLAELTRNYQQLAQSDTLAPTLHRVIETRLATLKIRSDAAAELNQAHVAQDAIKQRQVALAAERKEIEERIAQTALTSYTAVGTLQSSSLQLTKETLYRLTDPANSRTVIYLRSNDPKVAAKMGRFVGVRGDVSTAPGLSLKVITPTDIVEVDPARLNHGITATIIPASLIPQQASVDPR